MLKTQNAIHGDYPYFNPKSVESRIQDRKILRDFCVENHNLSPTTMALVARQLGVRACEKITAANAR
jgi:hypothetical protein